MRNALIRQWLLEGERRVYSMILVTYGNEFLAYKPKMFRKWLAAELDVPEEKINISSLNSAFARNRKAIEAKNEREKKENLRLPVVAPTPDDQNNKEDNGRGVDKHKFTNVEDLPKKTRIREL